MRPIVLSDDEEKPASVQETVAYEGDDDDDVQMTFKAVRT